MGRGGSSRGAIALTVRDFRRSLGERDAPVSIIVPVQRGPMDPKITMVTLGVEDLEAATAFYRDGIGWPQVPWEGDIAFFETTGSWLALFPSAALAADANVPATGSGFRGFTLAHNVDSTGEVDAVLAEAERAGATVVKPASETDWGGYAGYFADLDGFLWEVAWNPHLSIHED